jgi:membrane-associated phospholipid phosphatase
MGKLRLTIPLSLLLVPLLQAQIGTKIAGAVQDGYSSVGYHTAGNELYLRADESSQLGITIIPDAFRQTNMVAVQDGSPFGPTGETAINQFSLNGNDVKNLGSVLADDPFRAVQVVPDGALLSNTRITVPSNNQRQVADNSLPVTENSLASSKASALQTAKAKSQDVTWGNIAPGIFHDQLRIWTFPAKLVKGQDLMPTLAVAGAASGLVLADSSSARFFRQTHSFAGFNTVVTGEATKWAILTAPVSLYAISLLRHDSYGQSTALLAGEALVSTEILTRLTKRISGRLSPDAIPLNGNFRDTWLKTTKGVFPSEHTSTAFAVATIFANRYSNHRWVPYVAYGTAGLIGFATMTASGHYSSDVFVGGVLGYSISKFAILRRLK